MFRIGIASAEMLLALWIRMEIWDGEFYLGTKRYILVSCQVNCKSQAAGTESLQNCKKQAFM